MTAARPQPRNRPDIDTVLWTMPASARLHDRSLLHHDAFATDVRLGRIQVVVTEPGQAHLQIDPAHWTTARRLVVPGGLIACVDHSAGMVMINLSSSTVRAAPRRRVDEGRAAWQQRVTRHYRQNGRSHLG